MSIDSDKTAEQSLNKVLPTVNQYDLFLNNVSLF